MDWYIAGGDSVKIEYNPNETRSFDIEKILLQRERNSISHEVVWMYPAHLGVVKNNFRCDN